MAIPPRRTNTQKESPCVRHKGNVHKLISIQQRILLADRGKLLDSYAWRARRVHWFHVQSWSLLLAFGITYDIDAIQDHLYQPKVHFNWPF